ncbi:MAG: lipopolysaccharide heptosyltransferase I [Pseudolabrys sp.]
MAGILFIKTSSLGDVIHHMPALSEARRQRPDARFVWVVEEAYAPLVRLHPAVGDVLPVAWRRWLGQIHSPATWQQIAAADRVLRLRQYDAVIDTQGLLKSALIASRARGRKHGYDSASIKEKAASAFYDVRHTVSRDLHAIERNRILTALSLGYQPHGAPHYGIDRESLRTGGERYAVLLHGTARPEKEWPLAAWTELGRSLKRHDLDLVLPWGNDAEFTRAGQIAAALPRARVADRMPLDGVARLIAGAEFVVGVDTGLLHLAAALSVPLVAIFGGSEPRLTGPVGAGLLEVVGAKGAMPSAIEVVAALGRITA